MSFSFSVTHTDGAARAGVVTTPHGDDRDADVHAGRHAGRRQGDDRARCSRTPARSIILGNTYHLWLRPGAELIARRGGLHRFNGWTAADPHRQRRLPGLQPGRAAQARRAGVRVPLAPRRQPPRAHAGARRRHPGVPRLRHRDGARRVPAAPVAARRHRDLAGAHDALGAALPHAARGTAGRRDRRGPRADQPRPGAVRHRAGRRLRRPAARERGGAGRARLRRLRDRRPERGRAERGDVRGRRRRRAAVCRPASRAI